MNSQKPREIASRVLRRHQTDSTYAEELLAQELAAAQLSPRDRALVHELVCGVVRWQATLDWLIARKTQGRKQKPALDVLLRLGLYQMFWLERVPDHAAVNETVDLARLQGFGAQAGFVNALLRNYGREREATRQQLDALKHSDPALGWSHPGWLVSRWQAGWGPEPTAALLEWNNRPARTFARANTLKTDPGKLLERWREEGVEYDFRSWDWTPENLVFELKSHPPLPHCKSFRDGAFYVQDPSTLLAVHLLEPKPGQAVLDVCAAPGGKTTFIAQLIQNQGQIVAQDSSPDRLEMLRENCARLGITCVETRPVPSLQFDRILVDAPCSNTGVMRRRVDLRWRLQLSELARLRAVQLDLLERAIPRLLPDGRLVYSTCSLEPEENREVVQQVLAQHPALRLSTERTLTPFADGVDGAYVAVIERHAS